MKKKSKKMAAEIVSALKEAALVRSGEKKIMKHIDNTAKKIARKINKRINGSNKKNNFKKGLKSKKAIKKVTIENAQKEIASQ